MDRAADNRIRNMRRARRRRRRRAYQRRILLSIMMIVLLVFWGGRAWSSPVNIKGKAADNTGWDAAVLGDLNSQEAALIDAETGEFLEGYNSRKKMYPASLTKIMTALLAVEHTENMDETVTLPVDFFQKLYEENASMAGFEPGETARLQDLLYGILLPSGAECCLTFAERIAGSEEAFVEMMNEKAKKLGMKNTHFCNATGLHEAEHYSTAEDMAMLLQYALKNETFRAAFTSASYHTMASEVHPEGFTFTSTMFRELDSAEVTGGRILGGKTGYTPEAGLCLASLAEVEGREYILVTAGAEGSHETEPYHILDAVKVYDRIGEIE